MSNTNPSQPPSAPAHQRRVVSTSAAVAAGGGILGLYLIISSRSFPAGFNSLPGPGFFPLILGLLIVVFSVMIAFEARAPFPTATATESDPTVSEKPRSPWFRPCLTIALLAFFLFSWELVPFLVRTPILVAGLMRVSGSSWRSALIASILFTAVVYGLFQLGLRVDLG